MAEAGERFDLELTDLARDGSAVGRIDGRVVFVAGALPGDRARVRVTAVRRGRLEARLEQLLEPSPQRRRPPCILADPCGGCTLQALDDAAERRWKERHLAETLRRIGALEPVVRSLPSPQASLGYRNRAVIPLERTAAGRLRAGYYRRGSHRIVNMNRCPVLDPRLDGLIAPLKADLEASGWPVDRHAAAAAGGGLRHLALRVGHHTGEVLIGLVAAHDRLPGLEDRAAAWMERWPAVVGVALNLQPEATNRLLGEETRTLAGRGWYRERFAGLTYRIGLDTFFQVHTLEAERVVGQLREVLGRPAAGGTLVDAYCGIGTFSLPLAADGWRVLGLEQHPGAVALATRNAAANDLEERSTFRAGTVGESLADALEASAPVQALLLDPPRRGLEEAALAAIRSRPPERVLYLSCDPATLARDLHDLCGEAYRLRWVQPLDFFPNTTHVEALALLERS
ncbi:MAG: 23S rRNA (uracil(1939)-C(5))-methyltransferase RlmD [Synechococcaceae cyanobacterium]|nr:23S rRNA (uracil(1939)-C(5))-methyltransferase RlmD [Synechococcaceae cyanobacterium]